MYNLFLRFTSTLLLLGCQPSTHFQQQPTEDKIRTIYNYCGNALLNHSAQEIDSITKAFLTQEALYP